MSTDARRVANDDQKPAIVEETRNNTEVMNKSGWKMRLPMLSRSSIKGRLVVGVLSKLFQSGKPVDHFSKQ